MPLTAVVLLTLLTGCGSSAPGSLSVEDRAALADALASVNGNALDSREPDHARVSVLTLLRLCDRHGDDQADPSDPRTVSEVARETAADIASVRGPWAEQIRRHCKP